MTSPVILLRATLAILCVVVVAVCAAPASAQVYTGRVEVLVVDATGSVLPGATVTLSGRQSATALTDARGEARFLHLAPGLYAVATTLAGFGEWRNENVTVATGQVVALRAAMAVGGLATAVEVTAASPVIDRKRTLQSTIVTLEELQQVPSARDPWVVLQTVPGVVVDRVNVAGGESGQQSVYRAKGAGEGQNTWNLDGIAITDMAALGSSPAYYDFDMFQEIQATTGGADVANGTPGVALNLVLKGGGNTPRGSARWYGTDEGWKLQATNVPADLVSLLGGVSGKGNRMRRFSDVGAEFGGPLLRDRLWAWGAFGRTDVTVLTLDDTPDQTILENYSMKVTAQATRDLRGSFTYYRGEKLKYGRGASPTRPQPTTWNQGGPTQMFKGEGNLTLGTRMFVTARYAYVDAGFFLTPQGGLDVNMIYADDAGIARNSWYKYDTSRPQTTTNVETSYFRGRHELKAGFGYRTADEVSIYTVPGNGILTFHDGYPNMIAEVTAWNQTADTRGRYVSGYVGNTISFERLTLNVGLRLDRQSSSVRPYSQRGNPILPSLLPDLTGQGADDVIVWNAITPRLGVTWEVDGARRTIARASYAQLASQMSASEGGFFSSVGSARGVYIYDVADLNGNGTVDVAEIAGRTPQNWYGFDIGNPAHTGAPNHVIGEYRTPITHEFILGLDRELLPNVGVSASYTFRHFTNFTWRPVEGLRADDYTQFGAYSGSDEPVGEFSVPFYGVSTLPPDRTRTEYVNRDGYSQRYHGLEVSATRRMFNRWMARFAFSWNDHREYFDGDDSRTDPTPTTGNPNIDGGHVMAASDGSGKGTIYMVLPQYQVVLNGVYQARWGVDLGVNMVHRQGFAMPYHRSLVATGDPLASTKTLLLVDDVTRFRLPSVTSLDLRLGKQFVVGPTRANLDLDLFNVLNSATVLGRQFDLRVTTADRVHEIMNPRILRLGVRLGF